MRNEKFVIQMCHLVIIRVMQCRLMGRMGYFSSKLGNQRWPQDF